MSVKITGEQFSLMWKDPEIWQTEDGKFDVVLDEETITVDGVEVENADTIDSSVREVVISSGFLEDGKYDGEDFVSVVKKWLKKQRKVQFVVECDRSLFAAVKSAIIAAGAKVKLPPAGSP